MAEELIGGSDLYNDKYREMQERLRQRSEEAARMADEALSRGPELRVVIADDQDLVRNGFKLILSSFENLKVVGEASNGREAVERVRETKPDVVPVSYTHLDVYKRQAFKRALEPPYPSVSFYR